MTLRKQIVEGDPLKTGGIVLPSGATQVLNGFPVAYIGGMATCFVCGVTGPIIKAGGGRRWEVAGGEVEILFGLGSYSKTEEVAMEDDEVVCSCPKHPQLQSVLSPTVEYDDEMSPLAYTGRVLYTAGADLLGGAWSLAKGTVSLAADQAALVVYGPLGAMGSTTAQQGYNDAIARNKQRVDTAMALPGAIADKAVDVWNNPSQLTQAENVGHIVGAVVPAGAAAKIGKAAEVGAATEAVDVIATTQAATIRANIAESAAARASSNFEQLPRFETAYDVYTNEAGFSADRALGHIAGIDRTQPVTRVTLPEGTTYVQHVQDGRVGNYFAPPGTPAEMLGINPASRVPTTFTTVEPTSALQSTAAPITDTWTVPNTAFNAQGGGTQFFVPNNSTLISGN